MQVPSNEYMRVYMLKRYHERRAAAIEKLGGRCVVCGTTDDLELDHVDPDKKLFDIAKMWSVSRAKFESELEKCQLLCRKHHMEKTVLSRGWNLVKGKNVHGTLSSYRYCKCDECREAYRSYMRKYKQKRRMNSKQGGVA